MKFKALVSIFLCCLLWFTCSYSPPVRINLEHLLSLTDSMVAGESKIAFVSVYSEAPDYKPVSAKGEGIACVDDVGRMMEVLEYVIQERNRGDLLRLAELMTNFLLYMCDENGYWNNFIYEDGRINKEHRNSVSDFGWWAVRGLRGLTASYRLFLSHPSKDYLLKEIKTCIGKNISRIDSILQRYPETEKLQINADLELFLPCWMIKKAPDITSECLLALTRLEESGGFQLDSQIRKLAEALLLTQYRDSDCELDGMFFSWRNIWHNWGNNQSLALLKAFEVTGDSSFFKAVRLWKGRFLPFIIDNNLPNQIVFRDSCLYDLKPFPQISYGINSLYRGLTEYYRLSGDSQAHEYTLRLFAWYVGENPAGVPMYDPGTGRCFDGIDEQRVNYNSGAESTIETLLALIQREKIREVIKE